MRNSTVISHSALDSDTLCEGTDMVEAIWWRLLCVADDWGRFPIAPKKLKRMLRATRHSEEDILQVLHYLAKRHTIKVYTVDGEEYAKFIKWDKYQKLKWRNDAVYPSEKGFYEESTNPAVIKRREKEKVEGTHVATCDTTKQNKTKQIDSGDTHAGTSVAVYIDLMRELIDKDYKITGKDISYIAKAYKALDEDIEKFESYARAFLTDRWVRLNRPGAKFFFDNINTFNPNPEPAGAVDVGMQIDVDNGVTL